MGLSTSPRSFCNTFASLLLSSKNNILYTDDVLVRIYKTTTSTNLNHLLLRLRNNLIHYAQRNTNIGISNHDNTRFAVTEVGPRRRPFRVEQALAATVEQFRMDGRAAGGTLNNGEGGRSGSISSLRSHGHSWWRRRQRRPQRRSWRSVSGPTIRCGGLIGAISGLYAKEYTLHEK